MNDHRLSLAQVCRIAEQHGCCGDVIRHIDGSISLMDMQGDETGYNRISVNSAGLYSLQETRWALGY